MSPRGNDEEGKGMRVRLMGNQFRLTLPTGLLGVLLLLMISVVFFTTAWSPYDYLLAGCLGLGAGCVWLWISHKKGDPAFQGGVLVFVAAFLLLFWLRGAVGVIGSEKHPANFCFDAILLVVLLGALLSRSRPRVLTGVMGLAAVFQGGVGMVALALGWGAGSHRWPYDVVGLTLFFVLLWLAAALLFRASSLLNQPAA
jgi:hypothetical protein